MLMLNKILNFYLDNKKTKLNKIKCCINEINVRKKKKKNKKMQKKTHNA